MLHRQGVLALGVLFVSLLTHAPASAQLLAGPWLIESEKKIDELRKTDLRVIVLDAQGKPAGGVEAHIEQLTGSFQLGVVLPAEGMPDADWNAPLWRCFNAVSLERMTDWAELEPTRDGGLLPWRAELIEETIKKAKARGMTVRWGPLISADVGRIPPWAAELSGEQLAQAVMGFRDKVVQRFGGRVDQFDVYTQTIGHRFLEERVGRALVRKLYEGLRTTGASAGVRFHDALTVERAQLMQRKLTELREAFVPVDIVAIDQRFAGTLERGPVERTIKRLDSVRQPVIVSSLTVGADSILSASINMDLVLRTLVEQPKLGGIWFAGLTEGELIEPHAALIDEQGELTASGQLVDSLFHGLMRSDIKQATDELGNVRCRVFPGAYRITATLKDGERIEMSVRIDQSIEPRFVLLEPNRPVAATTE